MPLDTDWVRAHFPALASTAAFLDNPGGTQIVQHALDRMNEYLVHNNANRGGAFETSVQSDQILNQARAAMADFLNASRPEEIVFGPNMTSLTFMLSRALGRSWEAGDEIIVTRLDHDANITPWVRMTEAHGSKIHWLDFDVEDCTLNMDKFQELLSPSTGLVAVNYASNAVGTINPLPRIIQLAHQAGALCFIDAVHYAPHGPMDVRALDCDFLALSTYKFFGPHLGVLYGRFELLDQLSAERVRPAPKTPPGKFETGTQNHEGLAGALGVMEYLIEVGKQADPELTAQYADSFGGQALYLKLALAQIRAYEMELSRQLLEVLQPVPGLRIYGLQDPTALDHRVPTFSFTMEGFSPRQIAELLAADGIYVWDGNYYALAVTERLGLEPHGGMVRVGPVHYNTFQEIDRLGKTLRRIAALR